MTRRLVAIALCVLFSSLSALHVFWAFGGQWGGSAVVPEVNGKPAFRPGRTVTLVVALLLAAAGSVIALRSRLVAGGEIAPHVVYAGAWTLALVFTLRAIGNFDTFGFFKKARATRFARYDTRFYSPFCTALGLGCMFVALGD